MSKHIINSSVEQPRSSISLQANGKKAGAVNEKAERQDSRAGSSTW